MGEEQYDANLDRYTSFRPRASPVLSSAVRVLDQPGVLFPASPVLARPQHALTDIEVPSLPP